MRILGVDPGSVVTGYGIIECRGGTMIRLHSGTLDMRSTTPMADRLRFICEGLVALIDKYHPHVFCLETAFYGKNIQSTMKLGQVRGVALLVASQKELEIAEYSPREIKRSVTGNGGAAKQQVEFMVKTLLNIHEDFRRSDEADGLALAICHALQTITPQRKSSSWKDFIKNNTDRVKQ